MTFMPSKSLGNPTRSMSVPLWRFLTSHFLRCGAERCSMEQHLLAWNAVPLTLTNDTCTWEAAGQQALLDQVAWGDGRAPGRCGPAETGWQAEALQQDLAGPRHGHQSEEGSLLLPPDMWGQSGLGRCGPRPSSSSARHPPRPAADGQH